jgi:hypothetical protein
VLSRYAIERGRHSASGCYSTGDLGSVDCHQLTKANLAGPSRDAPGVPRASAPFAALSRAWAATVPSSMS